MPLLQSSFKNTNFVVFCYCNRQLVWRTIFTCIYCLYIYIFFFLLLIVYWVIKEKLSYALNMCRACSSQACGLNFCMIHLLVTSRYLVHPSYGMHLSQAHGSCKNQVHMLVMNTLYICLMHKIIFLLWPSKQWVIEKKIYIYINSRYM